MIKIIGKNNKTTSRCKIALLGENFVDTSWVALFVAKERVDEKNNYLTDKIKKIITKVNISIKIRFKINFLCQNV